MLIVANWTFPANHAWALLCIAQDPEMLLRDIVASRGGGWVACQASCGLRDATTKTTAVVIAAEGASLDRPLSVTARGILARRRLAS